MKLLKEARLKDVREKYRDTIDDATFDKIVAADPSNAQASKPSKYVDIMCKFYLNKEGTIEEITDVIISFNKKSVAANFPGEKDIYKYKTLKEIKDVLDQTKTSVDTSKDPAAFVAAGLRIFPGTATLVHETPKYFYVSVTDTPASVYFSQHVRKWAQSNGYTPWCTSIPKEEENSGHTNLFHTNYKRPDTFFIIAQDKADIQKAEAIQFNFKANTLVPGNLGYTNRKNSPHFYSFKETDVREGRFKEYYEMALHLINSFKGDLKAKIEECISKKDFSELMKVLPIAVELQPVEALVEYFYKLKDDSIEASALILGTLFRDSKRNNTESLTKIIADILSLGNKQLLGLLNRLMFSTDAPKEHYALIIKLLNEKKLDPNYFDPVEKTPLYSIIINLKAKQDSKNEFEKYREFLVSSYLNAGADPNKKVEGKTLIEYANTLCSTAGNTHAYRIMRMLMEKGAKFIFVKDKLDVINDAVDNEEYEFAKSLVLSENINLAATGANNVEPLFFIVIKYHNGASYRTLALRSEKGEKGKAKLDEETYKMGLFVLDHGCSPTKLTAIRLTHIDWMLKATEPKRLNLLAAMLAKTTPEEVKKCPKTMAALDSPTVLPEAKQMLKEFLEGKSAAPKPEKKTVVSRKKVPNA